MQRELVMKTWQSNDNKADLRQKEVFVSIEI
jgi:hypothetical protein